MPKPPTTGVLSKSLVNMAKTNVFLVTITCIWSKSLVNCQKDKTTCTLLKLSEIEFKFNYLKLNLN